MILLKSITARLSVSRDELQQFVVPEITVCCSSQGMCVNNVAAGFCLHSGHHGQQITRRTSSRLMASPVVAVPLLKR